MWEFEGMTTLSDVDDAVYIAFNKQVVKLATGEPRSGIHVSDVIEPKCMRYVYYGKKLPLPLDGQTCKTFYFGNMIHEHSELATIPEYHEFQIAYNPFQDACIDLDAELKNHPEPTDKFWGSIVVGKIDDVIRLDDGAYMIADKKSKLSRPETLLFGKPYDALKEQHRSQVNLYRLLLLKKTGIDAKYGCILSLDIANKCKNPQPQPFELDDVEKTRTNLIHRMEELVSYLNNNKLPPRLVSRDNRYMCNEYCPYYSMCFTGDGINV